MNSALIYARISTQGQADGASLESQIERCREYAAAHGFEVIKEISEIYSGSYLFDRPKLNEAREEIRAGIYDALIVFDIDRLSRNVPHLGILLDECTRFNTKLLFVNSDFENSPEGILLFSIKGYVSEVERLKIIERTTRGRRAKAKIGTLSFKRKLYGYYLDEHGKRHVFEDEAKTVRFIFEEFLSGESLRGIASKLNAQGIETPSKKKTWWANSVYVLLKNPAFCGRTIVFRQKKESRFKDGKRVTSTKQTAGESQTELPDDITPAIISEKDFEAAQKLLVSNRKTKRGVAKTEYLLRGLITCARCGRLMSPQRSYTYRAYVCTSKQNPSLNCGIKMMNANEAESLVWKEVLKILKKPERLSKYVKIKDREAEASALEKIRAEIAVLKRDLKNLVSRSVSMNQSAWDAFKDQIDSKSIELEAAQKKEKELLKHGEPMKDIYLKRRLLDEAIANFAPRAKDLTFTERTAFLKQIHLSGVWDGEELKLYFGE
jgi:site-specific DNA recombinase